jgi:hypothetical protein
MVYPPATSEAGAGRPAIIQLEQCKEASSKPAQLKAFRYLLISLINMQYLVDMILINFSGGVYGASPFKKVVIFLTNYLIIFFR